ncbi:MAG: hypothetical protein R2883_02300 [Caldisericia bacterium]
MLEENKALKDLKKIQKAYIQRNMGILQDSVTSLDKKINNLSSSIEGNGELKKRFDSITSGIQELVNIIDQFEKEVQNYS